jgi:pentatricopeptide repeat protein
METLGFIPDIWAFNVYLDLLCRENKVGFAVQTFFCMVQRGREPDVVSYTILINGLFRAGKVTDAVEIWNAMIRSGVSPDNKACAALVVGLCHARKVDLAYEMVAEEIKSARVKLSTVVYNALISGFCKAGRIEKAEDLKSYMSKIGCEPDLF